ncbi:MAG: c-type cytochrome [bacterium]|nr:c-type cytochrome [bacterium]
MEEKYLRLYKILTIIAGMVCIVFLGMSALEENVSRQWRTVQSEFKVLLTEKATTDRGKEAAESFDVKIRQVILDDFKRIDRCVSCHQGIDNPNMTDEALPHRAHGGKYLEHHPVEKFGCTICHGGQGRALIREEALATEESMHWEYPVLPLEYSQSSCGKCHMSIYGGTPLPAGAEVLEKGRRLFMEKGCLACHKVRGTGGTLGTDLTDQGSKTRLNYSFRNLEGDHNVANWLAEHFVDPAVVSPGSQMMRFPMSDEDMQALVTFTMGMYRPVFPIKYYDANVLTEFRARRPELEGKEAYKLFCAVCHGKNGEGKDYREYEIGIPSLNNQDFLATASEDMLNFTIRHGRSGRLMSAWMPRNSGLSEKEVDNLVQYVRAWKVKGPAFADVQAQKGDKKNGASLYRSRCGTCHGADGEGGIGPSLNNGDFLRLASDRFLFDTITKGRANTGMPSWSRLTAPQTADILAFVRDWQTLPTVQLSERKISGDIKEGESLFKSMCVGCHGKYGQGGVGPGILNRDFLAAASDEYIRKSIADGRRNTPMISWSHTREGLARLEPRDIDNLTAYARSMENHRPEMIPAEISTGVPTKGKTLFKRMCSGCHGVNGEGEHGPALNNQEFLNGSSNGFIHSTIALGRSGTAMRSWARGAQGYGELDGEEIDDIVTFIRTWQTTVKSIK